MANNQICASCLDFSIDKVVKSKEDRKPTWLHKTDFVRQFINNTTDLRNRTPEKYDVVLKLNIDKRHAGKKMLYWAADKKRNSNFKIEDARKAYNNFENSGITTIDRNGHVTIKFCCPQVYRAKKSSSSKPHTYFRHLHFVVSDDKRTKWNPQIYTKIVVCKYDCAKTLDLHTKKSAILLNTLPSLYYDDEHIPGSHNLPHETIIKGDEKYLSIASASILAKHSRDLYMKKLHKKFPLYFWGDNKGYPTKKHKKAIKKHGVTIHHRKSFKLYDEQLIFDF